MKHHRVQSLIHWSIKRNFWCSVTGVNWSVIYFSFHSIIWKKKFGTKFNSILLCVSSTLYQMELVALRLTRSTLYYTLCLSWFCLPFQVLIETVQGGSVLGHFQTESNSLWTTLFSHENTVWVVMSEDLHINTENINN